MSLDENKTQRRNVDVNAFIQFGMEFNNTQTYAMYTSTPSERSRSRCFIVLN